MRTFKTMWVVSIDTCPEYVTTTKEKAFKWLREYIKDDGYSKEDTEKIINEIKEYDFIENVYDNRSYAIDEVFYED